MGTKVEAMDEARRLAADDPWTDEQETLLLEALIRWKPTGIHKHFRMIAVASYLQSHGVSVSAAPHTRIPGIWAKLRTLFDLDVLDEREIQHFWTEYASELADAAAREDDGSENDGDGADEQSESEMVLPTRSSRRRRPPAADLDDPAESESGSGAGSESESDTSPVAAFSLPVDEFEELMWHRRLRRTGAASPNSRFGPSGHDRDRSAAPSSSPDIPDLCSLRPTAEWIAKRKADIRSGTPAPSSERSSSPASSLSPPMPTPVSRSRRRTAGSAAGLSSAGTSRTKGHGRAKPVESEGSDGSGGEGEGDGDGSTGAEDEKTAVVRGRRGKRGRGASTASQSGAAGRRKRR